MCHHSLNVVLYLQGYHLYFFILHSTTYHCKATTHLSPLVCESHIIEVAPRGWQSPCITQFRVGETLQGPYILRLCQGRSAWLLRSWAKFFISLAAATVITLHYAHPCTLGTYSPTTDAQTPATSATSSPVPLPTIPDAIQLGPSGGAAYRPEPGH